MIETIDFDKGDGLIPVIVQDYKSLRVLMLAYMNRAAFLETERHKLATFYSRSKKRLWAKGEVSGNSLHVKEMKLDCDNDTLLLLVEPVGPACHTGTGTCWGEDNKYGYHFMERLEQIITKRKKKPKDDSYTSHLIKRGYKKIAQKVGEEATEYVIEAVSRNKKKMISEGADLFYHFMTSLVYEDLSLADVMNELEKRHSKKKKK